MLLLFLRAYSLGGGTYTGIEAVSNGLQIMREPRVETGRRTMAYMAVSLALTASGILVAYLLLQTRPVGGKTMNAVLAEQAFGGWQLGGLPVGYWLVLVDDDLRRTAALRRGAGGLHRRPARDGEHGRGLVLPAPLRRALGAAVDAERRAADGRRGAGDALLHAGQHPHPDRDVLDQRLPDLHALAARDVALLVAATRSGRRPLPHLHSRPRAGDVRGHPRDHRLREVRSRRMGDGPHHHDLRAALPRRAAALRLDQVGPAAARRSARLDPDHRQAEHAAAGPRTRRPP